MLNNMKKNKKEYAVGAIACLALALVVAPEFASAAADPFAGILGVVRGWLTSSLGKLIAIIALLVGGFAAVMGSLKGCIIAFGLALIIGFGPSIIDTIFTIAA